MKRLGTTFVLFVMLAALPFAQGAAAPSVLGQWDLTTVSPVGENTNIVEFRKDGETLKAFAKGPQGERAYDSVAVDGAVVTLVMTVDFQGQPMTITYAGTMADDSINGSADFGGMAMGNFSATRKPAEPTK